MCFLNAHVDFMTNELRNKMLYLFASGHWGYGAASWVEHSWPTDHWWRWTGEGRPPSQVDLTLRSQPLHNSRTHAVQKVGHLWPWALELDSCFEAVEEHGKMIRLCVCQRFWLPGVCDLCVYMKRLVGGNEYLAARELCQVGFQLFANHRVDSHQTEHAGLANAALCVVIALRRNEAASGTACAHTYTGTHEGSAGTWEELQRVQSTHKHFQRQIRQIFPTVQIWTLPKYAFLEPARMFPLRLSPRASALVEKYLHVF